jgi:hypothetical protein
MYKVLFSGRYNKMKIVFYEKGELSIIVGASKLKGELTIEQIKNESEKKAKELGDLLGREIGFLIDMNGKLDAQLKK